MPCGGMSGETGGGCAGHTAGAVAVWRIVWLKDVVAIASDGAMVIFASRRQDAARHSPAGASSLRWLCARLSLSLLREDRMRLGIARREQVPCLCTGLSLSSPQPKMNCYVIVLRKLPMPGLWLCHG